MMPVIRSVGELVKGVREGPAFSPEVRDSWSMATVSVIVNLQQIRVRGD